MANFDTDTAEYVDPVTGFKTTLTVPSGTGTEETRLHFYFRPTVQVVAYDSKGRVIDRKESICAPEDEFDFWKGCQYAFRKLIEGVPDEIKKDLWGQLVEDVRAQGVIG